MEREPASSRADARAQREVRNQLAALRHIERFSKAPAARASVLHLHRILAHGVMDQGEAGRLRRIQVRVGEYLPPPAASVPRMLDDLLGWWRKRAIELSPVVSQAILHHRFEQIHPFSDGNGRPGRALALWELYRRGFDTHHIFSVDEVYLELRPRYYAALDHPRRHGGDLTGWIEFSAEALHLTLERVWTRVQRAAASIPMSPIHLRPRQEALLLLLREHGPLPPREIWSALSISKQGALDLMRPLLAAGLVGRTGTRKSGRYELAPPAGGRSR